MTFSYTGSPRKGKPQSIAAYCFILGHWFYWNSQTEQFDLMEVEPGQLVKTKMTPIAFRKSRRYPMTQGCEWVPKNA